MNTKYLNKLEYNKILDELETYAKTYIGKEKCLKLFHQSDFPSIKVGRKFWIKADCLDTYLSQKRIMAE